MKPVPDLREQPERRGTNPKDLIGSGKVPVHLWPTTATIMGAIGISDGRWKYGRTNWRAAPVFASIYFDALLRHAFAWFEGEDRAPDTKVFHLSYMLANAGILADAWAGGTLVDDRALCGGYHKLLEYLTPEVDRIRQMHATRNPRHYTIADNEEVLASGIIVPRNYDDQ